MVEGLKEPTIADFINAGYPCLFMRTVEPQVAEEQVRTALVDLEMGEIDFGVWKITTGLQVGRADGTYDTQDRAQDLKDALVYVEKAEDPVVVVFHHMRKYLDNHVIIQAIIDATFAARLQGSHLIFVGPHIDMPPELRTLITYVDIPLPSVAAISKEYEGLIQAYSEDLTLPDNAEERSDLIKAAATAAVGLDMMGAENALALSLATSEEIDLQIIQAQKEQEVRKSDVLEFFPVRETLDDVGGFDILKEWLEKRKRAFTEEAREYGLPYPRGILIVGPAGTGKSLTAKAVGSFLRIPVLRFDMGKIFRSLVGESEAAVRLALQVAEAVSPVVLWMDELEKGMSGMKGSGELDSGVTSRVVSTILTWRQETKSPVMLVATANDVATLPAMVYRKGRLDEVFSTDLPTLNERKEILAIHLRKRGRDPNDFNIDLIATRTKEYTGAELEGIIEDAMFTAFDEGVEVNTKHILKSGGDTIAMAVRDDSEVRVIREWADTRARKVSSVDVKPTGSVRVIGSKPKTKKKR